MSGLVTSDLTEWAHVGYVAAFPQVSERVGSSQGPSRSRYHTEIGKTGDDFNEKVIYKGVGRA